MIQHLKTLPDYFQAVIDGKKPFEIRENDRDFKVGDRVILEEYLGKKEIPECRGWQNCPADVDINGNVDCSLLNDHIRRMCVNYSEDLYSGRRCLIKIKDIFKLDKIGLESYVAFTFDILNITNKTDGNK